MKGENVTFRIGSANFEITDGGDGKLLFEHAGRSVCISPQDETSLLEVDGRIHRIYIKRVDEYSFEVWIKCQKYEVVVEDQKAQIIAAARTSRPVAAQAVSIQAPMPGLVTSLAVEVGGPVASGQRLLTLEAMKMENEIRSPIAGSIKSIHVKRAATVDKGQILIIIEPSP
jgi:biotin carboxyl carrier protein